MSLRGGSDGSAGRAGPVGPFTLNFLPSPIVTVSKKHMYGLCRDSDPVTVIRLPVLSSCGVIPLRVS